MSTEWITVEPATVLENGVYEILGSREQYDPGLPIGHIEIYDHPERGQSYWDHSCDDGTDYADHVSTSYLIRSRVRKVAKSQPAQPEGAR